MPRLTDRSRDRAQDRARPWATLGAVLCVVDPAAILLAIVPSRADHGWGAVLASALVGAVTARAVGLQRSRLILSILPQLPLLILPAATAAAALVATSPGLSLDRGRGWAPAIGYLLLVFAVMSLLRAAVYVVAKLLRRTHWCRQRTVVVGADELGRQVATVLLARPEVGLWPVGIFDCGSRVNARGLPLPQLGELGALAGGLVEHAVTTVVFACSDPPEEQPADAVRDCVLAGHRVFVVAGTYPTSSRERGFVDVVGNVSLVELPHGGVGPLTRAVRWMGRLFGVGGEPPAGSHRGSASPAGPDEPEVHARQLAR